MIVAGGGTGGHVFPGIAVALEVMEMDPGSQILYVGARQGMERTLVPRYGLDLELLNLGGIKGKSLFRKAVNIFKVGKATLEAMKIIHNFKPDLVFGVGGYASYPVISASRLCGVKCAILEQNTVAGLANRVLGRFVNRVYTAFEYTTRFFPKKKVVLTGNPLRKEMSDLSGARSDKKDRFVVFVVGGSQGAVSINKKVVEALDYLGDLKNKISFVHQTGQSDLAHTEEQYKRKGFEAKVFAFIDDMADAFVNSDVVVSRSGSGICEILAAGKPSILVPYPYSSYDHQNLNADVVVDAGAGVKIADRELTGSLLAERIKRLFDDKGLYARMSKNALTIARPDATKKVAEDLLELSIGD